MQAMNRVAGALLAVTVILAGCGDAPSAPKAVRAAQVEPAPGTNGQTAFKGDVVPVAPAVLVRDGGGAPLPGTKVSFVVTQGGGTVDSATATTNASGIASAGRWALGPTEGVNQLEARVASLSPVRFTATAMEPQGPVTPPTVTGAFDITVRYVSTPTLRQRQAVDAAVARWRTAIVGDLPDIPVSAPKGTCFETQPALNEMVDDLLLLIEFIEIDGPGKVLGQAGPCYVRTSSGLPVVGVMSLDVKDLEQLAIAGTLDDVVLHEMGHVLGIGTLWTNAGLLAGTGTDDPHFTGANALSAYRGMGGLTAGVPVENTGTDGTREGHWRESVFGNELMTGWVSRGSNPLSGMTIASLGDMGYGASLSAAGTYTFSRAQQGVSSGIELRGRERLHGPRFRVDPKGRKERIG